MLNRALLAVSRAGTGSAAALLRSSRGRYMSTATANMNIVRFIADDGEQYFGVFSDVTQARCRIAQRDEAGRLRLSDTEKAVDIVLPPVDPPAVYCVGLNYVDHAREVKMDMPAYPILFSKPVTALTGHNSAIIIPAVARDPPEVDYEAELAVVIGTECKNVSEERAMDVVLGYTVANDVSARRWQGPKRGGGQWLRGKAFDTFLPLGPYIVPKSQVPDPHNLKIRTLLNGELVQDGNTASMFYKIPQLISFISQGTTLLPGTVICTGTPAGVGYTRSPPLYLKRGDVVSISIEGIGTLRNPVAADTGMGLTEL